MNPLFAALAMLLAATAGATQLTIEPWTGTDLQVTPASAAKYRLEVTGKPKAVIRLRATDVADGWLAAFCTPRFCEPERVDTTLSSTGQAVFQFELIRESETAPKQSDATITESAGAKVTVPTAYRD